jgi:hypothetical protein
MEEEYRICFETYEISNFGNVRRKLLNGEYKILKCSILNRGAKYKYFQTNREKKRINYLVHHLVAKLFIGNRPDNLVIDHIDRNSLNNNVNNLRYITQKENCHNTDKYIEGIEGEGKERNKLICKKWREEHREEIRIKKKIYKEKNKEILKQKNKEYYLKNRDSKLKYQREYKQKIKEQKNN